MLTTNWYIDYEGEAYHRDKECPESYMSRTGRKISFINDQVTSEKRINSLLNKKTIEKIIQSN